MFYHFLYPLHDIISGLNIFRYISFRVVGASMTALILSILLGTWVIGKLQQLQVKQYIREEGPASHQSKAGTPTMGGILILFSVVVSVFLWGNFSSIYVWIVLLTTLAFGFIGFLDDWLMLVRKTNKGLSSLNKFVLQVIVAVITAVIIYLIPDVSTKVTLPFFKDISPNLYVFYIFFAAFIIVAASNAVNLTDGLDGLAIGPVVVAAVTFIGFSYLAGHKDLAQYLQVPFVNGTGELSVLCGAVAGAGLGFLWFNAHPAEVFMGDVGSLPLGAFLGSVAVIIKQEFLLVIVGGIFVVEALSVILQVGFFKITKGRRIFRMAPLHHHFELKGWKESKVTIRFWIIAIILSLIAVSTLKIR